MAEFIDIDINAKAAARMLKKLAAHYGDPKQFYKVFQLQYFEERKDALNTKGASLGYRWAPLHIEYVKQKRKAGYAAAPWVMTGRTRKALTGGRGGGRRIRKNRKKMSIRVGAYPGFHDSKHGTTHPFYTLNFNRSIQADKPSKGELDRLDKAITQSIYSFDRKVSK